MKNIQNFIFNVLSLLFLLSAVLDSGTYKVPFLEINISSSLNWNVQNGYLAFAYLIDKYFRHGLTATNVTINEISTTATTTLRNKVQEITLPPVAYDTLKLIRSSLGDGKIRTIERTVQGSSIKITIEYENS